MRTVLFGLDGATYTVLDHLVAEGVMPNLAAFQEAGSRATLLSTPHPLTPQAWTTLATGRSAGHHGIHDFLRPEAKAGGVFWRVNDARDIHCETIWEYASRRGKQVTVLNYYGTSPPLAIKGHSIPAFVTGRHLRRSSHPPDVLSRLRPLEGFDANIIGLDADKEVEALQDMDPERWCDWIGHHIRRERAWFAALEYFMTREPSDLTAIVFDGVDRIQHLAFRFLDPALVPEDPTPWEAEVIRLCRAYFRQIDDFLGRTVDIVGDEGRVFVASDHGFTASRHIVYINKWLSDQGLLGWRSAASEDDRHAIYQKDLSSVTNHIDPSRTKAYALTPSCMGLYITVPPSEYEAFREDLVGRLLRLEGPDGRPIVEEAFRREDAFSGPFLGRIPDVSLRFRDGACLSVLNAGCVLASREQPVGTHHPHGVLMGRGPGVRRGATIPLLNLLDVAPLLLHSLGLGIPADYEGTFPDRLYEPEYLGRDPAIIDPAVGEAAPDDPRGPSAGPPVDLLDEDDKAGVLDRLRSLGYVE